MSWSSIVRTALALPCLSKSYPHIRCLCQAQAPSCALRAVPIPHAVLHSAPRDPHPPTPPTHPPASPTHTSAPYFASSEHINFATPLTQPPHRRRSPTPPAPLTYAPHPLVLVTDSSCPAHPPRPLLRFFIIRQVCTTPPTPPPKTPAPLTHARRRQVHGHRRAQSAAPHHQHAAAQQPLLRRHTERGQQQVPRVALHLCAAAAAACDRRSDAGVNAVSMQVAGRWHVVDRMRCHVDSCSSLGCSGQQRARSRERRRCRR